MPRRHTPDTTPTDPPRAALLRDWLRGYKLFVAWRYLMVSNVKVPSRVLWLAAGGLVALALLVGVRALHLEPDFGLPYDPLDVAAVLAAVFVTAVLFIRVLRYSKPSLILGVLGLVGFVPGLIGYLLVSHGKLPWLHLDSDQLASLRQGLKIATGASGGFIGLALFFGTLRARFTFFTTVPIGGVWIGTSALVIVLSVMGGFESDLRQKILGSNAHLQITREDGDFTNWREIKARIDAMPGVVASTPFAVSEVVVAANNTGMNVIIKGIDPKTVGKVTDLVSDLEPEDRDAMQRLDPITGDSRDLRVPQRPRTGPVIDPPPPDMPTPGDPIDFSGPDSRSGSGAPAPGADDQAGGDGGVVREMTIDPPAALPRPDVRDDMPAETPPETPPEKPHEKPHETPGDRPIRSPRDVDSALAKELPREAPRPPGPVVDPPPPDLITSDEPPADYSRPDYLQDAVRVIDPPFDTPSISRRTQSLPGILVGRELVKQTHLYVGQEVRVVSPLSDPANPDATGTPIPFNRDYRVAGKFFTGMYEYDLKYVYVTLDSLQEFLDRGDAIDGIEVRVVNPYDTDVFVALFQQAFGSAYRVQDWKELNRSLFSALKLEKIAMFLVLGIVILVASFSIVGNLIMVVVEKAREIALLKTLGASDAGVMQLFAIQGLMIGVIGTLLGVATGLLGCWVLSAYGFPLNENVYYIDRLPIHVDPPSVAAAAAAGILISIAATLYPAVVAARVRPAAGMRL
jgi:lipoprotein-releasing system permease protein